MIKRINKYNIIFKKLILIKEIEIENFFFLINLNVYMI